MMTDIHVMPAEATAPSRRERRKAETRRRLLDAARELFVERGFDATRPQDVARLADVGSGTFYVHFADKREAFCAVTEQAADELMQCMGERAQARSQPATSREGCGARSMRCSSTPRVTRVWCEPASPTRP
jgi:AcrR family transcriptional regulator